jgi:cobaltochelatase CobS
MWDELNLSMLDSDDYRSLGFPQWVSLSDLSITELKRVLRYQFPDGGSPPREWDAQQVRDHVRRYFVSAGGMTGSFPEFNTEYGEMQCGGFHVAVDPNVTSTVTSEPEPEPSPTLPSGGDDMMEVFMSGILQRVRAEGKSIVEEHVSDALSDVITGAQFTVLSQQLRDEIDVGRKVVVQNLKSPDPVTIKGTHPMFEPSLQAVANGMNLFLVGGAGSGKTYMTKQIAEALSLRHHMISCTADMMRHDLFGFIDAGGNYHTTALRKAWEQGGLFVVDEVDLASANLMGGLNDVANVDAIRLEFPDESVLRHPDFRLVACANTIGEGATSTYRGRNALDGAFLDRFVFISVELDEAIETRRVMALMSDQTQAVSWLGIVRQVRRNIKQYALPTIITPRAAMHGAQLLELGNSVTFTVTSCITRGCSDDVARKLLDGVEVMP